MSLNLPTLTDRYFRRQRLPHAKRRSALYCALGAALWLATVNASKAHDVDCDRLIKTNAPFELRTLGSAIAKNGNEARSSQIFQIYRSDSGLTTTYSKFVSGNSMFEGKRISYGPFVIELTARTIKTIKTTYEYHGIDVATVPLDTNYEYEGVMKSDNGKVQAFRTSYTYIGKEAALVGGCRLEVIKYNSKSSTADGSGTALRRLSIRRNCNKQSQPRSLPSHPKPSPLLWRKNCHSNLILLEKTDGRLIRSSPAPAAQHPA